MVRRPEPEYRIGQNLIINNGANEGCCFTVRDREWRDESWVGIYKIKAGWYYLGAYGWKPEGSVSTERHYRLFS